LTGWERMRKADLARNHVAFDAVERYEKFMLKIVAAQRVVSSALEKRDIAEAVMLCLCAIVRPEVVRFAEADTIAIFGAVDVGVAFVHETDTAKSRHIDVTVVLVSGAGTIIAKGVDERGIGFAALEEKRDVGLLRSRGTTPSQKCTGSRPC
jgi:hypothetical protein